MSESALDAQSHIFRHDIRIPAELAILQEHVRPGMRVLDVGCAATGRSALLLKEFGCEVTSIEINPLAIQEFGATPASAGIDLVAADLAELPFPAGSFDLVLIAFHGMDYLLNAELRRRAYQQVNRVLKPAGKLVFNGFNRLGIVFNPQVLLSPHYRRGMMRYLASGALFKPTFVDENNLRLHQATPASIIREVEGAAPFKFAYATNKSGQTRNLLLVSLLASAPYYVFARAD